MLKKKYLSRNAGCSVTFILPADEAQGAGTASVLGDFNAWDGKSTPMARDADGNFMATMTLEAGREYRFRYLLDGRRWENDGCADKYEANPYGNAENGIVIV